MFEVTSDDIAALDDESLRALVGLLSEAECRRQSLPTVHVTWGGDQRAEDGGVDVRVDLPEESGITGFIPRPKTVYQVKAEDMPKRKIETEMQPKGSLRPFIYELARNGGAYIIVSSKGSVADTALTRRRNAMIIAAQDALGDGSLELDFYDRTRIASWVNNHYGLVVWVREKVGRSLSGWRPYADWSSLPGSLEDEYVLDEHIRIHNHRIKNAEGVGALEGIKLIRDDLRQAGGAVRLVGLSGVGKTRLVQALFDDRIGENALSQDQAIYTDVGSDSPYPSPTELLTFLIKDDRPAVIIVDNCGAELHSILVRGLGQNNEAISLITVEYDISDDEPERTNVFRLEPSSTELIGTILEQHFRELDHPNIRTISDFSGGNARIAIALASTVEKGESLTNLRDAALFNRLFYQNKDRNTELFAAAKACALVYSFDGKTLTGTDAELPSLATLAELRANQLYTQVVELNRRQLVQKRGRWRALLPHAIAHRLARIALEEIPPHLIQEHLVEQAPARLFQSFTRRLGSLHDSQRAQEIVSDWLKNERFDSLSELDRFSFAQFRHIAPVNPEATLQFMERLARADNNCFAQRRGHRSEIIRLLRSLAYDPDLFERSCNLLVRFACKERADDNNADARNTLKSMFHSLLSGVQARPAQRAKFVKGLLDSHSEPEVEVGLSLLSAMLEATHFSSNYSFEFGAHPRDYGWRPKSMEEQKQWYESAIEQAADLACLQGDIGVKARSELARNFRGLITRAAMIDKLIDVTHRIHKTGYWAEGWLAVRATLSYDAERLDTAVHGKLLELEKTLKPQDLEEQIRSHALSTRWGAVDVVEGDPLARTDHTRAALRIEQAVRELGKELASHPELFEKLLHEILTLRSTRVDGLGYGLASAVTCIADTWEHIARAYLNIEKNERQWQFLGGFVSQAYERNQQAANKILDSILEQSSLRDCYPYLQSRVPFGDIALDRILRSLEYDDITLYFYLNLRVFMLRKETETVDPEKFDQLFSILAQKKEGFSIAVDLISSYLHYKKDENQEITERDRQIASSIMTNLTFTRRDDSFDYQLSDILSTCFSEPSDESAVRTFSHKVFQAIQAGDTDSYKCNDIFSALAKLHPEVLLDEMVEKARLSNLSRDLFSDIREFSTCPLDGIPISRQIAWAKEDSGARFPALADNVQYFTSDKETKALSWSPIATQLINESQDPAEVLERFYHRFEPMPRSGSRAAVMEGRLDLLEQLIDHHNPTVSAWARTKLPKFKAIIDRERSREEASERDRDKRFE